MDFSPPGSSVHGILQERRLEWVWLPFPSPGDLPNPGIELRSLALQADSLPFEPPGKPLIKEEHWQSDFQAFLKVNKFSSVTQLCLTLRFHGLQHVRSPCPSPTPGVYSNSCPLSRSCHPTISSSIIPFSSHLQSFPASGCFPMSQFCASGGQSIGVSALASVLPMNIQCWFPFGWTGWISLLSKGLSRVFSNTTVQKHQFFSARLSL